MDTYTEANDEERKEKVDGIIDKLEDPSKEQTGKQEKEQAHFNKYFKELWSQHKRAVKQSSKQETAKHFFILGIQLVEKNLKKR